MYAIRSYYVDGFTTGAEIDGNNILIGELILENLTNGFSFLNTSDEVVISGEILWVNREFTAITGFSADDAVGQTPRIRITSYNVCYTKLLRIRVWVRPRPRANIGPAKVDVIRPTLSGRDMDRKLPNDGR